MSDDAFEFNSDDFDALDLPEDKNENDNNNKDNKNGNDDFKMQELPKGTQNKLSVIDFTAIKPQTASSITISDATNESLNNSRPALLPARLTNIVSTPSQNQTSADEDNKLKFDLSKPLFDDLGDDDEDDDDQPDFGPIQFPDDPCLDKKDQNNDMENKTDSITINSVSSNTSIFGNMNKIIPDSPLKNDFLADEKNDQGDNSLNSSMKPKFLPDLSQSANNNSNPLDNFDDDIDAPRPLIPSRKRDSMSSFPLQSLSNNRSPSKPSFLNINEIKNIKPGDPISNTNDNFDKGIGSLSTPFVSPEKSPDPFPMPKEDNIALEETKYPKEDIKANESKEEAQNNDLNVITVDDDDDVEFSSVSLSDDEKDSKPKKNSTINSEPTKNESQQLQSIQSAASQSVSASNIAGQKTSQINVANDSKNSNSHTSSLNESDISNDFFMESETTQPSKSQEPILSEKVQQNQSIAQANPATSETFQSINNNKNTSLNLSQQASKSNEDDLNFTNPIENTDQQKKTPPNNENRKLKTELGESAQKVKQIIQQSAKKQQQQKQQKQQQSNVKQPIKKEENRIQKQEQQLISPPIRNSTETPMNSTSQSPSPPNSSEDSFQDNIQYQPNNSNKTQTAINMTKADEPLSSISLHLSSDQRVQKEPVKKTIPRMAIEIGVENSFDNASAQFQRLFMNEFASLMRPTYQMPYDTDVDYFVDYLAKDINKELSSITKSYSPTSRKIRGISQKIDLLFDQGRDVLNEKLANSYENDLQRRAQNYQKLRNLQSLVDDLNKSFSAKVTKTMKVIDNYIKDSALFRSNRLMKAQVLQKNLRELTLERMHLEAKVNKQISEFEDIDRHQNDVIMSYISFSNDPYSFGSDDQSKTYILKKIAREINLISSCIDKVTFEGLAEMANEGQLLVNEERAKIREEYSKIDGLAEKLKLLKQNKHKKKSSSKKKASSKKKS